MAAALAARRTGDDGDGVVEFTHDGKVPGERAGPRLYRQRRAGLFFGESHQAGGRVVVAGSTERPISTGPPRRPSLPLTPT